MTYPRNISRRTIGTVVLAVTAVAALVGCSTVSTPAGDSSSSAGKADTQLQSELPEDIVSAGVLTVRTPLANPPMIFVDGDGKTSGVVVDLADAMGDVLGVHFQFSELAFPSVIPGLQSQKFDLSMGVIGDTAEREKILDFVDLARADAGLLIRKADEKVYAGLSDLCGKAVGALAGSLQVPLIQDAAADCTQEGKTTITVSQYQAAADAQTQLAAGRIDGFLAPYVTVANVAKTAGDGELFTVPDKTYPSNAAWAIAMTKDRGSLAKALQGALLKLKADGNYDKILQKYGLKAIALSADEILINGAGQNAFGA